MTQYRESHGEASTVSPSIDALQGHGGPANHLRSTTPAKFPSRPVSSPTLAGGSVAASTNAPLLPFLHLPTTGMTTPPAVNSPAPSILAGGITAFSTSPLSVSTTPAQHLTPPALAGGVPVLSASPPPAPTAPARNPAPPPAFTVKTPAPAATTVRIPALPGSVDHDRPFGLKVLVEGRDSDVE